MKILVIDDQILLREALRAVLRELRADVVILEAPNGKEAMRLIRDHSELNLILLDLNLPDCDGYSMLEELGEHHPEIAVVVMSGRQDRKAIAAALDMGGGSFIPKTGNSEVMLRALQLVLAGGIYVPPQSQRDAAGFDQTS